MSIANTSSPASRVRYDISTLTDLDVHLFNEGRHFDLHNKFGAHIVTAPDGTLGTSFAVWAPNARSVSVFGNFNEWDKTSHALRPSGSSGIWHGFIPDVGQGAL